MDMLHVIKYAESRDGIKWNRLDHLSGIDVSPDGWDSEMIEYPFVFDHKGQRYMLSAEMPLVLACLRNSNKITFTFCEES